MHLCLIKHLSLSLSLSLSMSIMIYYVMNKLVYDQADQADHLGSVCYLVETHMKKRLQIFPPFVDFSKAYDSVNRSFYGKNYMLLV